MIFAHLYTFKESLDQYEKLSIFMWVALSFPVS